MQRASVESSRLLYIGLSSWIIQDGNYGDFAQWQEARFALKFHPRQGLHTTTEGPKTARHLTASQYHGSQVVFAGEGVWVIDTGH